VVEDACLNNYSKVFANTLGKITNVLAKNIPYALKPLVQAEKERLEKSCVITKIKNIEWTSASVPVVKSKDCKNLW
jgi:hypothetical protein